MARRLRTALAAGVGVALLAGCGQSDRVELRAIAPSTTAAPSPVASGERDPLPVRERVVPTTRASRSSGAGGRVTVPGRATVRQPTTGPAEIVALIHAVFGPAGDSAVGVCRCESKFNQRAVSPGGANLGLMQVNRVHRARWERMGYSAGQMLEAEPNLRVAKSIYDEQGWRPWACRWAA